jgi:hypothetical protein
MEAAAQHNELLYQKLSGTKQSNAPKNFSVYAY